MYMIGKINQIETMGLVDGPGIRVVIFMQGCPIRCIFCHNPDTWDKNDGKSVTPKEILDIVLKYKSYFGTEGGVTFSGGEPLMQEEFLLKCLKLCKKNDINTCIDTSGVYNTFLYKKVLKYTDLVIMDIKALDEESYKEITGYSMTKSLEFMNECKKNNVNLWIRQVVIPNINDNSDYMNNLAMFLKQYNIKKIELLPYQTLGVTKYKTMGISYPLKNTKAMDVLKCKELESELVKLLSI